MQSNLAESARLIREALLGPPSRTELRTESGRVMRIERDPEPGVELRLVSVDSEAVLGDLLVLSVKPVDEKPNLYPAIVPFVSGTSAIVGVFGEMVSVAWRLSEVRACPMPEMEPDPKLEELAERLKSLKDSVEGSNASDRAAACVQVKALIDSLDPDTRASLDRLWETMQPEPEVLTQIERVFETVLQASIAEGWHVVERKDAETPFRALTVELARDECARRIFMMSMFPGSSVMLVQNPRESEAAA